MADHELELVDLADVLENQNASRFKVQKPAEQDVGELARVGKKQVLKERLSRYVWPLG